MRCASRRATEEHTVMLNLNKTQKREVLTAIARLPNLGGDYAARCLSALHRAALRDSQKRDIAAIAASYGLTRSADWII